MTEAHHGLPAWVSRTDGRLVPFEPDRISGALFAATESLGRPDPLAARELCDGVLHFLAAEEENTTITSSQVADLVAKVVRELGQPAIARAFLQRADRAAPLSVPPRLSPRLRDLVREALGSFGSAELCRRTGGAVLRDFSLEEIFAPEVVAAHHDGLLTLGGLESPSQAATCVMPTPRRGRFGLAEAVEEARTQAGEVVSIDGAEETLAMTGGDAQAFLGELRMALRATGLRAILNLNAKAPPGWAEDLAGGPLFAAIPGQLAADRREALAETLLHEFLEAAPSGDHRLDWHLSASDFHAPKNAGLAHLMRRAAEGLPIAFVFDRPRRVVRLAEGIDRDYPTALIYITLHLRQLVDRAGAQGLPERFLEQLASLARLALSAAAQKREFLRHYGPARPTFLADRARVVVVPGELAESAQRLGGSESLNEEVVWNLRSEAIKRLEQVLEREGTARGLQAVVDSAPWFVRESAAPGADDPLSFACLIAREPHFSRLAFEQAAARLSAATLAVAISPGAVPSAESLVALLRYGWRHTRTGRMCFYRRSVNAAQLRASWDQTDQGFDACNLGPPI